MRRYENNLPHPSKFFLVLQSYCSRFSVVLLSYDSRSTPIRPDRRKKFGRANGFFYWCRIFNRFFYAKIRFYPCLRLVYRCGRGRILFTGCGRGRIFFCFRIEEFDSRDTAIALLYQLFFNTINYDFLHVNVYI